MKRSLRPARVFQILALIVVLLYVAFWRVGWIGIYSLPTDSMAPTIQIGERIFASRATVSAEQLDRDTLVVFDSTMARMADPRSGSSDSVMFVDRLVGLPGDRIEVLDNEILVNGTHLKMRDGALPSPAKSPYGPAYPLIVPPGELFVLGDHYRSSLDSRYIGCIPVGAVKKVVRFRLWPIFKAGRID